MSGTENLHSSKTIQVLFYLVLSVATIRLINTVKKKSISNANIHYRRGTNICTRLIPSKMALVCQCDRRLIKTKMNKRLINLFLNDLLYNVLHEFLFPDLNYKQKQNNWLDSKLQIVGSKSSSIYSKKFSFKTKA